jgi:hypothetical protein
MEWKMATALTKRVIVDTWFIYTLRTRSVSERNSGAGIAERCSQQLAAVTLAVVSNDKLLATAQWHCVVRNTSNCSFWTLGDPRITACCPWKPEAYINPLNAELNPICHLLIKRFNVYGSERRKYIPIYIQQDETLHSLFISGNSSTCFGWYFTHHQKRIQLYLQHLVFVTPLLLSAAIVEEFESVWVCYGWRTPPTAHSKIDNVHPKIFRDSFRCIDNAHDSN